MGAGYFLFFLQSILDNTNSEDPVQSCTLSYDQPTEIHIAPAEFLSWPSLSFLRSSTVVQEIMEGS